MLKPTFFHDYIIQFFHQSLNQQPTTWGKLFKSKTFFVLETWEAEKGKIS